MCPMNDATATPNPETTRSTVGICGAGIGGLVLALRLARLGFRPIVLEARTREAALSEGEFLTLAPNGMNGLRAVDCYEDVVREGVETKAIELRNAGGRRLFLVNQTDHRAKFGAPSVTVKRGALTRILIAKCEAEGIAVHFGRRVSSVAMNAYSVSLNFTETGGLAVDILVAADGLRSLVRSQVFSDFPAPHFTGLIGAGGIVDADVPATDGVMRMTFGDQAFFGYITSASGSAYWFNSFAADSADTVRGLNPNALADLLRKMHADDPSPNPEILREVKKVERSYPIFDMPPLPVWSRGRVVLLGDAAHAIGPHAGQGASMAIEDSLVLSACLAATLSHADAFARYEALRRPRIAQVVKLTRQNAARKRKSTRLGLLLRDLLLPLLLPIGIRMSRKLFAYRADLQPLGVLHAEFNDPRHRQDAA